MPRSLVRAMETGHEKMPTLAKEDPRGHLRGAGSWDAREDGAPLRRLRRMCPSFMMGWPWPSGRWRSGRPLIAPPSSGRDIGTDSSRGWRARRALPRAPPLRGKPARPQGRDGCTARSRSRPGPMARPGPSSLSLSGYSSGGPCPARRPGSSPWSVRLRPKPLRADNLSLEAGPSAPSIALRASRYLKRSRVLLLAVVNSDRRDEDPFRLNLPLQKKTSAELLQEAAVLKKGLRSSDRRLERLISDLEMILRQISNLTSDSTIRTSRSSGPGSRAGTSFSRST